jgi:hypothetical protein
VTRDTSVTTMWPFLTVTRRRELVRLIGAEAREVSVLAAAARAAEARPYRLPEPPLPPLDRDPFVRRQRELAACWGALGGRKPRKPGEAA